MLAETTSLRMKHVSADSLSASFRVERGSPTRSNVEVSRPLELVRCIEMGCLLRLAEPRSERENFDGECRQDYMVERPGNREGRVRIPVSRKRDSSATVLHNLVAIASVAVRPQSGVRPSRPHQRGKLESE